MKQKSTFIISVVLAALLISLPLYSNEFTGQTIKIVEFILDNGLPVFFIHDDSSAVTFIQILLNGGKKAEPDGKEGLAYLATRLMLEIPDQGKVQTLMSQSTRLSMNCMADFSQIEIACLTENLDDTLKLAIELFSKPLFSGNRIDHLKTWMAQRKETQDDDSINIAHDAYADYFFRGTSYSSSILGCEKSLKAIKTKDVKNFYEEYFRTGNLITTVSSDMEEDLILPIIKKHFLSLEKGSSPPCPEIVISQPEKQDIFFERDRKQSLVSIGYLLPQITPRNYALAVLLETLLGKGVNSKLWPLRAESKLAYNVNSQATLLKEGGFIEAYLETDNEKKELAEEALIKILNDLYENGIEEDELDTTKTYARSELLRDLETKRKKTSLTAAFESLGLGSEFINTVTEEIQAVTVEEFNSYLKKILDPNKNTTVIVGPGTTGL